MGDEGSKEHSLTHFTLRIRASSTAYCRFLIRVVTRDGRDRSVVVPLPNNVALPSDPKPCYNTGGHSQAVAMNPVHDADYHLQLPALRGERFAFDSPTASGAESCIEAAEITYMLRRAVLKMF